MTEFWWEIRPDLNNNVLFALELFKDLYTVKSYSHSDDGIGKPLIFLLGFHFLRLERKPGGRG